MGYNQKQQDKSSQVSTHICTRMDGYTQSRRRRRRASLSSGVIRTEEECSSVACNVTRSWPGQWSLSSSSSIYSIHTIAILTIILVSWTGLLVQGQPPPPPAGFLDFDNLPVTRFSCEGKVIGGYYADVETGCQMFHVCTLGQKDEVQDIKFLCLNGTVFDQETRVCERVDEVDCSKAEQFYDLNLELYAPVATTVKTEPLYQAPSSSPTPPPPPSTTTTRTTTTATTTTTTTTTTTPRPRPRAPPPSPSLASVDINPKSNPKGYSSYTYYHQTPTSLVSSGYNSQHRPPSYFVQQNRPQQNSARKVPSGPKTIIYQSSTSAPLVASQLPPKRLIFTTTTTTPRPQLNSQSEETPVYPDEYYDEEDPDYAVSSRSAGGASPSNQATVTTSVQVKPTALQQVQYRDRNSKGYQQQTSSSIATRDTKKPTIQSSYVKTSTPQTIYYSKASSRVSKDSSSGTLRSSGVSSSVSSSTIPTLNNRNAVSEAAGNSTEEPFYYDDDYESDNAEYYDDNDNINAHDHHFSHVDVPRIPFAKPNVPRVLVTNGKPFLPRLRRQSHYYEDSLPAQYGSYSSGARRAPRDVWNYFVAKNYGNERNMERSIPVR